MVDVITVTVEAPQNPTRAIDLSGPAGDPGDNGFNGWSPVFATASDGARRVQRIVNWTGGTGTKPAVGQYVGATSLVTDIADAVDIRGPAGTQGVAGPAGEDGAVIIGGSTAVLTGEGPPDNGLGVDEQLYFDTTNSNLYQKESGVWVLQANLKGAKGDTGDVGPEGPAGSDGIVGSDGDDGADGATIRSGSAAPNDAVGSDGDFYIRTANGDLYEKSAGTYAVIMNLKGPVGATGPTGAAGTDGADGSDGADGAAATVTIGAVTTGAPGSSAEVSNSGTSSAAVLDFTIPRGATGEQGPAGADGAHGDDGPAGADGAPGPTLNPLGVYNGATSYSMFDSVHVNGVGEFYSLVNANVGNDPASSPSQWYKYAVDGSDGADGATGPAGADGDAGPAGATGAPGDKGWSPVFAIANDGERRVLLLANWVGGQGAPPESGKYVGALGLVTDIGDAVDFRGAAGTNGTDGADGADGADGEQGPPGPDPINAADFMIFLGGTLDNSQKIFKTKVVRAFTLPTDLAGSYVLADTAATAIYVLTFKKNGSSIGTATFAASGTTATLSVTATTFAAGDVFEITGAATADTTLADLQIALLGSR